jgi:hypothetical protein
MGVNRQLKMDAPMKPAFLALSLATLFAMPMYAKADTADAHATDTAQIQQLIEQFKDAIREKNSQAMHDLFQPGGSWLQGLDQTSLAAVRAKKPGVKQFAPDNYEHFAKFIGTAPKPVEEIFDNVRIQTDGTVGTVYFDYRFLDGGKQTNHGVETWQLVHTEQGWKISAMLYSVILDDFHG